MEFLKCIARFRCPALDALFGIFTLFGEELFAVSIICILYWSVNKQLARKICLAYFGSGLTVQALKITFCIPRPWILDPTFHPVDAALKTATGYSFPSGHTQSSTALFGSLAAGTKAGRLKLLLCLLFAGTGLSRMYMGVHTPKDVLVAMAISLAFILLIHKAGPERLRLLTVSLIAAAFSAGILIYAFLLSQKPGADLSQLADCFKAAGAGLAFSAGWYIEPAFIGFDEKAGRLSSQLLKTGIGLLAAILLKAGLKYVLGAGLLMDALRYFLIVSWIMVLYPLCIKKWFNKQRAAQTR